MKKVGLIGWRGMVGSVLMQRMQEENDFKHFSPVFFSTSQIGSQSPIPADEALIQDAFDLKKLQQMAVLVSCQGSEYTEKMYPLLRAAGWQGYWIDAASFLRMQEDSIIVLDPVNHHVIEQGLMRGVKNYIGGNCTVSLMLLAIGTLLQNGLVEWISNMTYQAASGAGAKAVLELIQQMNFVTNQCANLITDPAQTAVDLERSVTQALTLPNFPKQTLTAPLIANLLPWIDTEMAAGQTREEWKGLAETNKILQTEKTIPVDGLCVRVAALRCHSQALTIKLTENIAIPEIENMIAQANQWVKVVPNHKENSLQELTPAAVSGKLTIAVGRIRKLAMGDKYLSLFTVGDQLLWGAAEPLRRVLLLILQYCEK